MFFFQIALFLGTTHWIHQFFNIIFEKATLYNIIFLNAYWKLFYVKYANMLFFW